MADIFLSYTEKDREAARQVATMLGKAGWTVWWDRRIPAGDTWRSVLDHALAEMRCMIVLWTARSIESEWVYEEASEGRRLGKLVPVMLEAVRPPAGFREIQAADLTGWDGTAEFEGWRMLQDDLEHLLGRPGGAQAEPEAGRKPETDSPAYDPADLRIPVESMPARPPRRILAWVLAGLLPLAAGIAYLGLKQTTPPVAVPTPDVPARPADSPVVARPLPPKQAEITPLPPPNATEKPAQAGHPPPGIPAAKLTAVTPVRPAVTTPAKRSSARCADLLNRMQLGESLSDEAQAVLQKECKQ
jgi:hypothetical protein